MPLTVVQLVPNLNMGGVERGTVEFAIYLKQQGHRPIVISGGGDLVAALNTQGIEHIEMAIGQKSLKSLMLIPKLKRFLVDNHIDIVHARSRLPAWLAYFALRKQARPPYFVTTLHGLHSVNRYASVMARGDAVIAVSKTAEDYLQSHFKSTLKKAPTVIYRGVDRQQFDYNHPVDKQWQKQLEADFPVLKQARKILLPGRLSALKGFENLLPWLQKAKKNECLLLTADKNQSNYSQRIDALLTEHQLQDRVIWLGTQTQMADLYAYVDITVSVNRKAESFGRTVLESLSVGTPVIGLNHGGVAEILTELFADGLVELKQPQQLITKLNQFLAKAPVVKQQELFSNTKQFEQTLAVYQTLVTEKSC